MVPRACCRAIASLAVVVACALSFPAASPAAKVVAWSKIERSLQPAFDPHSTNPCNAGALSCPASAVAELQNRFALLAASCSHEAVFSLGYLRTTQAYYAAVSGDSRFFFDNAFVNHEDGLFADKYFRAYDQWYAGNHAAVPPAWQVAFHAADARLVNGTGDLLLGANAHINRDLPFVLDAIGLTEPSGQSLYPDHERVNDILEQIVQPVISEEARRFDPTIGLTEFEGTTLDDEAFFRTLVSWRETAWLNAERLANAQSPQDWQAVAASIESSAKDEADIIVAAESYRAPLTSSDARDAYCATHWNS